MHVVLDRMDPENSHVEDGKTLISEKPVFEVLPGSAKTNYKDYAEYMDKQNPNWRLGF